MRQRVSLLSVYQMLTVAATAVTSKYGNLARRWRERERERNRNIWLIREKRIDRTRIFISSSSI